ncbi:hypothetical protein ANN_03575 [Periplaneta americana]|uniref:Uncharacterized protein n=1 Tax=Periplaneta americana TaxID=6978 RepID=A0ABQ8U3L7_PERAM|nr:hypothetical protein ANN_03575 [Periplaneta americana]
MAGLCEDGNELAGSLKNICKKLKRNDASCESMQYADEKPSVYSQSRLKVVVKTNSIELVSIVRSRNMFAFSSDERSFNIESYFRTVVERWYGPDVSYVDTCPDTICELVHCSHWLIRIRKSGAIFTEDQKDSSSELAFKYAVYRINKDKDLLPNTTLVYDIQYVPRDDSFRTSKKAHLNAIDLGRDQTRNLEHRSALYRLRYSGRLIYPSTSI